MLGRHARVSVGLLFMVGCVVLTRRPQVFAQTTSVDDDTVYLYDLPDTAETVWDQVAELDTPGSDPTYFDFGGVTIWGDVSDSYYDCNCGFQDSRNYEALSEAMGSTWNLGVWYVWWDYYGSDIVSWPLCTFDGDIPECPDDMYHPDVESDLYFDSGGEFYFNGS